MFIDAPPSDFEGAADCDWLAAPDELSFLPPGACAAAMDTDVTSNAAAAADASKDCFMVPPSGFLVGPEEERADLMCVPGNKKDHRNDVWMKRHSGRTGARGGASEYASRPERGDGTFYFCPRFKLVMPYALFSKDQQISKAFATAEEVWERADTAGLVEYYEKDGRRRRALAEQYRVKRIPAPNGASSKQFAH